MRRVFVIVRVALFVMSFNTVYAHSHLANPLPTRELHCRVGSQQGRDCYGPCPIPDDYGRLNYPVSEHYPAETWARGQVVNIRWHRDNHDGSGFVRLALVPVPLMMDKEAHKKFAFHYACMGTGLHICPIRTYDVCGNDGEGRAWQTQVRIPAVYPDGVYTFGWSWYGGGDYRDHSFFGDYYSCSFVRIRGGIALEESFVPIFANSVCRSSVNRLGVCWSEPCHIGPMFMMLPVEFQHNSPTTIRQADLQHLVHGGVGDSVSAGGRSRSAHRDRQPNSRSQDQRSQKRTPRNDNRIFATRSSQRKLRVAFLDLKTFEKTAVKDAGVYNLKDFANGVTVEAFYKGSNVHYVEFYVDNVLMRRERKGPYVMNGNHGQRFYKWDMPIGRMVKIQVSVIIFDGATYRVDERFEADVQFNVV